MEQHSDDGSLAFLGIEPGEFVKTRFEVGWNPEIVREIRQTNINTTLLWGGTKIYLYGLNNRHRGHY